MERFRTFVLVCSLLALPLLAGAAPAAAPGNARNWPQWRGPLATGAAPEANPPQTWSQAQNIKWKVKVPGRGTATPIVWGDQVFIQTAVATGKKAPAAALEPEAPAASPVL